MELETLYSAEELKRLQRYASAHGLTLEEAQLQLFREEMARRYRLPAKQGSVVPFQSRMKIRSPDDEQA